MNYADLIQRHDHSFYEAILPYINEIPDMRPQETLKRMKQEPQNTWRGIYEELVAIGYRYDDQKLLEVINDGDLDAFLPFLDDKDFLREFAFSYPYLLWLMSKISPLTTVQPLIVALGPIDDIDLLSTIQEEDIPKLIPYIRSKETARILYEKNPSALSPFDDFHFLVESIGGIYWSLVVMEKEGELTNLKKRLAVVSLYHAASLVEKDVERAKKNVKILLSLFSADDINTTQILSFVIEEIKNMDVFYIFLRDRRIPVDVGHLEEAVREGHVEMVRALLEDDRVHLKDTISSRIYEAIEEGDDEISHLLREHLRTKGQAYSHIFH